MRRRRVRIELEIPDLHPGQVDSLVCLLDALAFDLVEAYGENSLHLDIPGGFNEWLREVAATHRARRTSD